MVEGKKARDVQVAGSHYKDMRIQPIEFGMANALNMCQALALRYIAEIVRLDAAGGQSERMES